MLLLHSQILRTCCANLIGVLTKNALYWWCNFVLDSLGGGINLSTPKKLGRNFISEREDGCWLRARSRNGRVVFLQKQVRFSKMKQVYQLARHKITKAKLFTHTDQLQDELANISSFKYGAY